VVSPQVAVVALLLAIALSLASGLLPAIRAARLDPMRALRYE
jgi:ABC-type antimicrobial peptide transport system permease subunit